MEESPDDVCDNLVSCFQNLEAINCDRQLCGKKPTASVLKVVVMVLAAKSSSSMLRTVKYSVPLGASLGIPLIMSLDFPDILSCRSCTNLKLLFLFRQKALSDPPKSKGEAHRWEDVLGRKGIAIRRIEPYLCGDLGVLKVSSH